MQPQVDWTSHYAPEMVVDMKSKMNLFVHRWSHLSSKEVNATVFIADIDIARLMIHVYIFKCFNKKD